ncbi:MAG: hypothetical protein LBC06_03455 [Rickettsiales bacterium]|jgi:hypothetical protein|nr:hypothetical protein [Rickettsiales bacterium]
MANCYRRGGCLKWASKMITIVKVTNGRRLFWEDIVASLANASFGAKQPLSRKRHYD